MSNATSDARQTHPVPSDLEVAFVEPRALNLYRRDDESSTVHFVANDDLTEACQRTDAQRGRITGGAVLVMLGIDGEPYSLIEVDGDNGPGTYDLTAVVGAAIDDLTLLRAALEAVTVR